ncbi:MAG: M17 family peptidase N-terminal domain-containing protein [Candidatus Methylomirabilales bacterium]
MTPPLKDPLEEVPGEVLVLFHFQDVPVPKHSLGKVDWYLSGAVSRVSVDGRFTGALDTAALFHPSGKFQVEKILVLGLGPRAEVNLPVLQAAASSLRSRVDDLRVRDIRIALPQLERISSEEAMGLFSATLRKPGEKFRDPPTFTFLTENTDTA